MNQKHLKIADQKMMKLLFWLCWLAYFSTYLGRLNYSASLAEIIHSEGFTKGQAGLIGTAFFSAYGIGQLISGFLGDRLPPKYMLFVGISCSAVCNFIMSFLHNPYAMMIIWCINGLVQSFIWSPIIRLFSDYFKKENREKFCISINSTVPIGTMTAYAMTAGIIYLSGWRTVFLVASGILFFVSIIWFFGMRKIETFVAVHGVMEESEVVLSGNKTKGQMKWGTMLVQSGFIFLLFALVVQGVLKDGVTTWVPTYISETYGIGSVIAIITTMIIPVFNLAGVYLASYINQRIFRDEIRTSGAFFSFCMITLLLLFVCSGKSIVISFLMLALSTTAMMAVNTMLIALLPVHFGTLGRASSVSGLLNSSVYVGGAISSYGIGALSEVLGWNKTILCWCLFATFAAVICFCIWRKWNAYKKTIL